MQASGISIYRRTEEAFVAAKEYLQRECAKYLRPVGSTSRAVEVGDGGRGFLNSHVVQLE